MRAQSNPLRIISRSTDFREIPVNLGLHRHGRERGNRAELCEYNRHISLSAFLKMPRREPATFMIDPIV